ncbi:MAG: hypothetical protein ACI81I_000461 [Arcobacteraceae bacterium]|jgi:hypothetical protein
MAGDEELGEGQIEGTAADNEETEKSEAAFSKGITQDEARLTIMEEEFTTATDSLHDDFEKQLETNPTSLFDEGELEMLSSDSDIGLKNRMLRDRFEKYRDEKLSGKRTEIDKFSEELTGKKGQFDVLSQSNKFAKENPTVDLEALSEFIQEDMSPRKQKELLESSETKYDFMKASLEEYTKANPTKTSKEDLPPDLSGVNGASGGRNQTNETEKKAYRKSIGLDR